MQRDTGPLWLWLLKIVLVGVAILAGCYTVLLHIIPGTADVKSLSEVYRRTDLHFPPGTRLVAADCSDVLVSAMLTAKLTMPRDQLDRLISDEPFLGHAEDTRAMMGGKYGNPHEIEGWEPGAAESFVGSMAWYHNRQYAVWVLADIDDPQRAIIYLRWELQ